MIRKLFFATMLISAIGLTKAQDVKKDAEKTLTKMDVFSSKTGVITKFVDTKLPNLKTKFDAIETRIRRISNGSNSAYFYQIEKSGKYSNNVASIEYNDLLEVIKALQVLKQDVDKDISLNPDYMENKFVTVDGFQVGYYVSGGKATWYSKLEKYGSDATIFIDSGETLLNSFTEAKNKIDELKK